MTSGKEQIFFKKHYPSLDLLRSIAITLVMLMHFNERIYPLPEESFLRHFVLWGWNGVGLFFALSGFLIGGQIIEALRADEFGFKKFYIKRFWRIFPPYYFSLLVVAVLFFTGFADGNVIGPNSNTSIIIKDLVYHTLYLQNYIEWPRLQGFLYWSLAVEEQFYILAPLLLYLIFKYFRTYFSAAIVVLILVGISIRFFLYTPHIDWLFDIRFPFHTRFDSLLFGVLAAYLFIVYNDRLRSLSAFAMGALFLTSLIAIGICLILGEPTNGYFNTCWQLTLTGYGFATLTLCITVSSIDSYIHKTVRKIFALIAKLSYTMYLYHLILLLPVGSIIIKVHKNFRYEPSPIAFILWFCVYFLSVLLLSAFIYQLIDRPSMNYRKKILKRMGAG